MNINLHRLQLFYYVSRHGGITAAAKKMPYGIDASSVSRQMCELERQMDLPLYRRREFQLTPAGERLFALVKPLFEDLPVLARAWRAGIPDSIRLGASPIVLQEYLPAVLARLQQEFPGLEISCKQGSQSEIEDWLEHKTIDLAVATVEAGFSSEYQREVLVKLPLILLVPPKLRLRSAADLWDQPQITQPLICLPHDHLISRCFRQGLERRRIDWPCRLSVNSLELVENFVRKGFGIGLSVAMPQGAIPKGLRVLPLRDFPHVSLGLIWRRKAGTAIDRLAAELRRQAGLCQQEPKPGKRTQLNPSPSARVGQASRLPVKPASRRRPMGERVKRAHV